MSSAADTPGLRRRKLVLAAQRIGAAAVVVVGVEVAGSGTRGRKNRWKDSNCSWGLSWGTRYTTCWTYQSRGGSVPPVMSPTRVANGVPSPGDTVNGFYCITGKTVKHVRRRMSSAKYGKDGFS